MPTEATGEASDPGGWGGWTELVLPASAGGRGEDLGATVGELEDVEEQGGKKGGEGEDSDLESEDSWEGEEDKTCEMCNEVQSQAGDTQISTPIDLHC